MSEMVVIPLREEEKKYLTPKEERELFAQLERIRRMPKSVQKFHAANIEHKIILAYLRLINFAAKKYESSLSMEDMFDHGMVVMYKAIRGFKPQKKFRFSTYLSNSLFREFKRMLDRKATQKNKIFYTDTIEIASQPDDMEIPEEDINPKRIVEKLTGRLTEKEKMVINLRFGLNGEQNILGELAVKLGVSKQRVQQIENGALLKLKKMVLEDKKLLRAMGD